MRNAGGDPKAKEDNFLDMTNLYGYTDGMSSSPSFTPVPRQSNRHDGWNEAKQIAFIDALAEYGMVRAAADKVGMGATSAYRLRDAEGAVSFAAAWDSALRVGMARLTDIAMDRAINGVAVPKYYKGELIGETRWYDNRLLMFMMRQTQTRRFGPHAADYDLADEMLAIERAREEKEKQALAKARALLDEMTELVDSEQEHTPEDEQMPREEFFKLCARRDRLEDLVARLTPADPVKEVDHYGGMKPGAMRDLYRRKGR